MRYGYFDEAHDEYVIERPDVPASWINYLGVKDLCTVINQNAGGYTFYRSSEHGRVTRFRPNSVPLDRPGHYLYLRDDDDTDFWSATWQPVGKPLADPVGEEGQSSSAPPSATYTTRHGLSYSVFESAYRGIETTQRIFIPVEDDVELWDVTVTNRGPQPRRLSLFGYVEFSFHTVQIDNQNFQMSLYAAGSSYADGILEYDFHYEPWTFHYFTSSLTPVGHDGLRDAFIGAYRTENNPLAVERGHCTGATGTTGNHCGALHHQVVLAPGESLRLTYLLGYGDRQAGQVLRTKYATAAAVDQALADLRAYWRAKQAALRVDTPNLVMNRLLNTWTLFQMETCVVWSRFASFVEVGGRTGLGYRDTAQDIIGACHTNPTKVRQRLWELLRGQMSPGYGLHLFDPLLFEENQRPDIPVGVKLPTVVPSSVRDLVHGLADACSDDHLWVVAAVVDYVKETGDLDFLRTVIPFADTDLPEAEAERLGSGDRTPATVYEHLQRAVDFTTEHVGAHGLAEGLRADWNDCLNLGGGETALVTFLHVWAARLLAETAAALGESADADRYLALAAAVTATAERELWDGDWYIRGYTRDGVKIGAASSPEGKIFLEHMPWAVIAGVASPERGRSAMDAVHQHLASPYGLHLTWPAYTCIDDTIGYITRVYPGVKENGAIFCHPNAWPIIAETQLGRGDRAMAYYDALAPARFNDAIEVRRAEPYVYCQFLFGRDHPRYGQAENPWLTGTAGWMYQAATKYILGVRPTFDALIVDPCIATDWDDFTVRRQWRGATYDIAVLNPGHCSAGVAACTFDGQAMTPVFDPMTGRQVVLLPPPTTPAHHRVVVTLGEATVRP
jgi:N,N'-diacetylchitobiose phosphorylase